MAEDPHTLGLALGGGAFRGTAHLGVLKALEEEGLRPGFFVRYKCRCNGSRILCVRNGSRRNPECCA